MDAHTNESKLVLWFNEVNESDLENVGGKNISLGLMFKNLQKRGIRVPDGFAVTVKAFRYHLAANQLDSKIEAAISKIDLADLETLSTQAKIVRELIRSAPLPDDLERAIREAYLRIKAEHGERVSFAVRSSATAEDLPDASFAGQQETYLNISGETSLLTAVKNCFASLYTDRAISYRAKRGIGNRVGLSVGVQQMVRSDLACSGVAFSIDPESGFKNAVVINSSYGLGEMIVQGAVNPDEFILFKEGIRNDKYPVLEKRLGTKEVKMVYASGGEKSVKILPVPEQARAQFTLSDSEVAELGRAVVAIEDYFSQLRGKVSGMDIEWAKDGTDGKLYILQARPETVHAQRNQNVIETYSLKAKGKAILSGRGIGHKIASGKVRVIEDVSQLGEVREGEILVARETAPDWEPVMKRVAGIITDHGGRTCHAAILSRELGIPAVIGTSKGTDTLRTGQEVTIDCAESDTGVVYDQVLEYTITNTDLTKLQRPKTKIMLNLANPEDAFRLSFLPSDGVGLVREEFIITNYVKVHPLALVNFDSIQDAEVRAQIDELTQGYSDKGQYFVDRLASGVGMIAAAFFPRPVIVRFSDFKTNEYAQLLGGAQFEPHEANPMIGFRGASRYYHPDFIEAFKLECRAIAKCREQMGLTNIKVMVPFCRTLGEAKKVITILAENGLRQKDGVEIYVMCEIPSNAILAGEFAKLFDGFSVGSNDLTQLTLGVDRDSELIEELFNERDLAVRVLIKQAIEGAHAAGKPIGICGQAPSDYPEFTQFLIENGIDSVSLSADSLMQMAQIAFDTEQRLDNDECEVDLPGRH